MLILLVCMCSVKVRCVADVSREHAASTAKVEVLNQNHVTRFEKIATTMHNTWDC
jgi:hypothetical protein